MSHPAASPTAPTCRWPRALALLGVAAFVGLITYGLLTKATNRAIDQSLAESTAPRAIVRADGSELAIHAMERRAKYRRLLPGD